MPKEQYQLDIVNHQGEIYIKAKSYKGFLLSVKPALRASKQKLGLLDRLISGLTVIEKMTPVKEGSKL